MYLDPRVESKSHHLCHVLFETLARTDLTEQEKVDKIRHDIFFTNREIADYWKLGLDKELKFNARGQLNEVNNYVKFSYDPTLEGVKQILLTMELEGIQGIRNFMINWKKDQ